MLAGLAGAAFDSTLAAGMRGDISAAIVKSSMTAVGDVLAGLDGYVSGPGTASARIKQDGGRKKCRNDGENE